MKRLQTTMRRSQRWWGPKMGSLNNPSSSLRRFKPWTFPRHLRTFSSDIPSNAPHVPLPTYGRNTTYPMVGGWPWPQSQGSVVARHGKEGAMGAKRRLFLLYTAAQACSDIIRSEDINSVSISCMALLLAGMRRRKVGWQPPILSESYKNTTR